MTLKEFKVCKALNTLPNKLQDILNMFPHLLNVDYDDVHNTYIFMIPNRENKRLVISITKWDKLSPHDAEGTILAYLGEIIWEKRS